MVHLNALKTCYRCKEVKPTSEFTRRSGRKSLFTNKCKVCSAADMRQFRSDPEVRRINRERMQAYRAIPENREKIKRRYTAANKASPVFALRLMIYNARKRSEVHLELQDLVDLYKAQNGKCAVSGKTMTWCGGRIEPTSMSLDRIDPDRPYTPDNVQLLCHAVNAFKGRGSNDQMIAMARAIIAHADKPPLWGASDERVFSLQ